MITYTSTLPENLMSWLKNTAQEQKTTKKQIIVEALNNFRQHLKKQKLADTFKKAAKDKEIIAMAEDGLDDYIEQLEKL